MSEIGEVIKNRRNELKINQQTLADLAGVSINTLVSIERGTGNPSINTLQTILNVLGLKLECKLKSL
ncbi:MAG: helix-turn-helix domain-containing protein [Bacteroidales bacterium]|nr:helix-turn-helix domain-containing protein [Bacteroidales bacterium]